MVPTHRIATGGECSNVLQMLGRRDGWLQTVGKQLDDTVVVINIMVNIVPAELLQSCLTLCDLVDSSQPGSSVHGILQARILKWVANVLFQGDIPDPGIKPMFLLSPALAGRLFSTSASWEAHC